MFDPADLERREEGDDKLEYIAYLLSGENVAYLCDGERFELSAISNWAKYYVRLDGHYNEEEEFCYTEITYSYWEWWNEQTLNEFKEIVDVPDFATLIEEWKREELNEWQEKNPTYFAIYEKAMYLYGIYNWETETISYLSKDYSSEVLSDMFSGQKEEIMKRKRVACKDIWMGVIEYYPDYEIMWDVLWTNGGRWGEDEIFCKRIIDNYWCVRKASDIVSDDMLLCVENYFTVILSKETYNKIVNLPYEQIRVTWLWPLRYRDMRSHPDHLSASVWQTDMRVGLDIYPLTDGNWRYTDATNIDSTRTSTDPEVISLIRRNETEGHNDHFDPNYFGIFTKAWTATLTITTADWWYSSSVDVVVVSR